MLYFANVWFGTSIGGLMDPVYLGSAMSWGKFVSVLQHLWIPVIIIGTSGTAGMIRRLRANLMDELRSPGHRQGQGPAAGARWLGISPADVAPTLHRRHRQPPAGP
ncbi:MAG: hypothetical protein R3C69_13835 [Geminicoccaceae bacterium]